MTRQIQGRFMWTSPVSQAMDLPDLEVAASNSFGFGLEFEGIAAALLPV